MNFDPPHEIQVKFDPNTDVKSISIPTLKTNPIPIRPHRKTKLVSIQTLNQVIFDPDTINSVPYTEIMSFPILYTDTTSVSTAHTSKPISKSTLEHIIFGLHYFACYAHGYTFLSYNLSLIHI